MSDIDLQCIDVVKRFGDFTAVDGVSFTIPEGSFFSILGPSGCGKTTLLRMVAGFLDPDGGDILIKGRSVLGVSPNRRPVNMVFQHLALFPMMTVEQNIAFGLRRRGEPRAEIVRKVGSVLERVGLPDAGPRKPDQLSGGQKQRIAIARALVLDPDVLLLDEPLGALDLKLREHMKIELKQLQHQFGTTFVYITHDQSEALVMSDHVAVMNEGRFDQVGTPQELYYRPQTAFVAAFVGDSNRWAARIETLDGRQARVATDDGLTLVATLAENTSAAVGDAVDVFVRPESIVVARDAAATGAVVNKLSGTIENVLFNGANSRIIVRHSANGGTVEVALPQIGAYADLAQGQPVHIGWEADQALCFASSRTSTTGGAGR